MKLSNSRSPGFPRDSQRAVVPMIKELLGWGERGASFCPVLFCVRTKNQAQGLTHAKQDLLP